MNPIQRNLELLLSSSLDSIGQIYTITWGTCRSATAETRENGVRNEISLMKPDTGWSSVPVSWRTTLWIVMLTLLVWVAFSYAKVPLDGPSTAVVALLFTIVLISGQWLWSRLSRNRDAPEEKPQ